jgi:hypothetical protein
MYRGEWAVCPLSFFVSERKSWTRTGNSMTSWLRSPTIWARYESCGQQAMVSGETPPPVPGIGIGLPAPFWDAVPGAFLGAPVEAWEISRMESWAREIGDAFPPRDYWTAVPNPDVLRYRTTRSDAYTRRRLDGIPVDDDLQYTLLGLFLLEQAGPKFSVDDVAEAWRLYLPFACTAEEVALANLRRGVAPTVAGNTGGIAPPAQHCYFSEVDPGPGAAPLANPYREWIGAAIRADPWGYVAPGRPECAAAMAFHDAFLSHRRNGIYAEMLFAATIAAAFVVDDPVRAVRIGLAEIPERSRLASAVRWALEEAPGIRDYRDAHDAAVDRFPGMSPVHAINNACLTVWGLSIGGTDLDRVLGEPSRWASTMTARPRPPEASSVRSSDGPVFHPDGSIRLGTPSTAT